MTWSNLARIVYRRTYARRKQDGSLENWEDTIRRAVAGNVKGRNVPEQEIKDLIRLGVERKAIPAGRGLWFSGTEAHERLGGVANCNCWYLNSSDWMNYVIAQDLLMLGGGVVLSIVLPASFRKSKRTLKSFVRTPKMPISSFRIAEKAGVN